jgi:hypothetical protein
MSIASGPHCPVQKAISGGPEAQHTIPGEQSSGPSHCMGSKEPAQGVDRDWHALLLPKQHMSACEVHVVLPHVMP